MRGWTLLRRAGANAFRHDDFNWAAALAYYFLFSLFPVVLLAAAMLSTLHLVGLVNQLVRALDRALPAGASALVAGQLTGLLRNHVPGIISAGFVLLIVSASQGFTGLMYAFNAAYEVPETRSLPHRVAVSVALTFSAGLLLGIALAVLVLSRNLAALIAGPEHWNRLLTLLWPLFRWGVAMAAMFGAVTLLYRYAPNVRTRNRGLSTAVASALIIWLVASSVLTLYIDHVAGYSRIYGALGAIIALMLWLYVLALALLLGAEIHAQSLRALGWNPERRAHRRPHAA